MQHYLDLQEAAAFLGISADELMTLRNRGEIPSRTNSGKLEFADDELETLRNKLGESFFSASAEQSPLTEVAGPQAATSESHASSSDFTRGQSLRQNLPSQPSPIGSRAIIEYLAQAHRVGSEDVEAVVDGFWNFVTDIEQYRDARPLVIPHFGTFRLRRQGTQTALAFRSLPVDAIRKHLERRNGKAPSDRWVKLYLRDESRDAASLSVKRRMAVHIASQTGQDLHQVYRLSWDLIEISSELFVAGDKKIRWAMRGEMAPFSWRDQQWYDFRCYERLTQKLPDWTETQRVTGLAERPATTRRVRISVAEKRRSQNTSPTRPADKSGCLLTVLVMIAVLTQMVVSAVDYFVWSGQ